MKSLNQNTEKRPKTNTFSEQNFCTTSNDVYTESDESVKVGHIEIGLESVGKQLEVSESESMHY